VLAVFGFNPRALAAPSIWTGSVSSTDWVTGANWGGSAPVSGNSLIFNGTNASSSSTLTDSLTSNIFAIAGITFVDGAISYTMTGNAFELTGPLIDYGTNTETINNAIALGATENIETTSGGGNLVLGGVISGGFGLTVEGSLANTAGAVTLDGNAANTYTGATTVNAGTLTVNYANYAGNNLISASSALSLAGGTLQILGNSADVSSQTVNGTAFNPGMDVISVGNNNPTLALGALALNIGSSIEFVGPATINGSGNVAATGKITTTTAGATLGSDLGLLWVSGGRYAIGTVGLYDWASTDLAAGTVGTSPYTIIGGSQVTGFYVTVPANGTIAASADENLDLLGGIESSTAGGTTFYDTMRWNQPGAATWTPTGSRFYDSGILITPNVGAANITFAAGTGWAASGVAGTSPIDVFQNNTAGEFIVNDAIVDWRSGSSGYVQAGPGTVVLNGVNIFTGPVYLNGGVTEIEADSGLGAVATAAAVNLNGGTVLSGTTFKLDNSGANLRPVTMGHAGGGLAAVSGANFAVDGVIGGAAGTGPLIIGLPTAGGLVPGTGANTGNATAVYATGQVTLTGANTFTGGVVLDSGVLNINGVYALGGSNYGGATFNGGTLQYATAFTGNGSGDISQNSAGVVENVTINSGGATIDTNGNSVTYANSIGNGGSGGLTVANSASGGGLTLNGNNTFSGGITVNSGASLTLGGSNTNGGPTSISGLLTLNNGASLGNTAVTVAAGGTLAAVGAVSIGTTGGTLTLNAGASLNMHDGAIDALTINSSGGSGSGTVLTLGGSTSTANGLSFDVGGGGNGNGADELVIQNGSLSFTGVNQENISLYSLTSAPSSFLNIPIISVSSGTLSLANYNLLTSTLIFGTTTYLTSLALNGASNELLLDLNPSSVNYYWQGGFGGSWAVPGNFATDHTGAVLQTLAPTSPDNVFLTADNPTNYPQTLDGSYSINSLTFTGSGTGAAGTSIILSPGTSGTNALTINASSSFADASGTIHAGGIGLLVQAGSAQHAISANIGLGSTQTWEIDNAPANGLVVSGTIGDGGLGYGINKTGPGTLILSGSNTYTGTTTITSGTLQLGNGVVGGSVAGNIVNNANLSLSRSDNYSLGNTISGMGSLVQNGADNITLTATNTFTGTTTINSGSLILGNPLALENSTLNTNGAGTLSFGSLTSATLGGLSGFGNLALTNNASGTVNLTVGGSGPATNYAGSLSGAGSVTKIGSSTLALSGANSYDGISTIDGGVLQISGSSNLGDGSVNNSIAINSATLESTANTYDLGVNRWVALTGSDVFQVDSTSALTVSGSMTGSGSITKTGAGTFTINGADTATGAVNLNAGVLVIGPNGSLNGAPSLALANGTVLDIAGGSLTLPGVAGNPYVDFASGGNATQVFVSGGSFTYGNNGGADPNEALIGSFVQTSGTVTTAESNMAPFAADTYSFYLGGGKYISNQGLYGAFTVGTRGLANAYISGTGSLTVIGTAIVGAQYSNVGGDTAGTRSIVQQGGTVNVTGLTLGAAQTSAASPGVYYLNGGTLTTAALSRGAVGGASTGSLIFGGGTFASGAALSTDPNIITTVNSGGAIIDTTLGNITWAGVIGAGSVGNVNGFTGLSGGSGYTTAPTVSISGGGGSGATGQAILNAQGQVIDVVITNPGSGYTSAPSFTFGAPGNGTTATITDGTIATGNGGLTKNGPNTLTLTAANTYSGVTTINAGILNINGLNALGGANYSGLTFNGGTLQYATSLTNGGGDITQNSNAVGQPVTFAAGGATIDTNGNNVTYANPIGNGGSGSLTVIDSVGTGSLTLNGNNTFTGGVTLSSGALTFGASNVYTGPTNINAGTLDLAAGASLGNTAITIASTATLALHGNNIGSTGASLTLSGGSVFNMQDGLIDVVTLNSTVAGGAATVLTIGGSTAPATLDFDLSSTSSDELIVNNGVTAFGADGGRILISNLTPNMALSTTTFTLISDPNGGLNSGTLQLGTATITIGGTTYSLSLANSTSTAEILTLSSVVASNLYWTGSGASNSQSWSYIGNFATDHTGATASTGSIGAGTNIFETADSAANYSQTLDGNYTVNSLSFTGTSSVAPGNTTGAATNSVTIASGASANVLNIDAAGGFSDANGNSYNAGTGIVVQAGSAAHTISANISLGNSQTWEIDNSPSNPLTVGGVVADGGTADSLTKTGIGTLVINGIDTYSGGTFVNAGTLALGPTGSLLTTGTLTVQGTGTFDLAGNSQSIVRLSDGGVGSGVITSSTGSGMLTLNNSVSNTFSGTITDAGTPANNVSLSLTLNGPGSVTLSGSNSYNGLTIVNGGSLTVANNYALGNPTAANGGLQISNPAGTANVYFTSANPTISSLNSTTSTGANIILGNATGAGSSTTLNVGGGGGISTYTGTISDLTGTKATAVGNLNVYGGGLVILAAANTFTGVTTITGSNSSFASELELENSGALQDSTLYYNYQGGTVNFTSLGAATFAALTGSQNLALTNASSTAVTLTLGNSGGVNDTYTGNLSGVGGFIKNGSNTVTLGSGTIGGATYAGNTTINQGTLVIGGTSSLNGVIVLTGANGADGLTVQDDATVNMGTASLILDSSTAYPASGTLLVTGTASVTTGGFSFGAFTRVPQNNSVTVSASGSFIVNGAFNLDENEGSTVAATATNLNGGLLAVQSLLDSGGGATHREAFNFNGGTLQALASDPVGSTFFPADTTVTATINAGGAFINTSGFSDTIAQALVHGSSGAGGTDGGLTVSGSATGVLILAASSTYTGPTTVSAGSLIVTGSLSGTVSASVAPGAKLEVDGLLNNSAAATVNGQLSGDGSVGPITVAAGATLAPGLATTNSSDAGTLTANGGISLANSTSTFSIRLGAGDSDQLALDPGDLLSLNGATLQLTLERDFYQEYLGFVYVIINGGIATTGDISGQFAQGSQIIDSSGDVYSILYNVNAAGVPNAGDDVDLELIAIPEPGTWAMMLAGIGLLCICQRSRRFARGRNAQ